MADRMKDKVVVISGAARGQGRAHAVLLAEEGADIIAFDVCAPVAGQGSSSATPDDLEETIRLVEKTGRRIVSAVVDARDAQAVEEFVTGAATDLGGVDVVVANAGVTPPGHLSHEIPDEEWEAVLETNLTGVFNTVKPVARLLVEQGRGGAIIMTSSSLGLKPAPHISHYVASKAAMIGLMRTMTLELGPHGIRVNTLHPTAVGTEMLLNDANYQLFRPDIVNPTLEDALPAYRGMHTLPIPYVDAEDVSQAVLYLSSEAGRYVTGSTVQVDAGITVK
jgi:(+)-trans-carveol dehydrogenase